MLQINLVLGVNLEHHDNFRFIGRILDLVVFHLQFLDAYFVPASCEMVFNKKATPKDLEAVDYELYNGLCCACLLINVVVILASFKVRMI